MRADRPSEERRRAFEILRDVRRGERADASLARRAAGLDPRGRAFLMELAYGTIRWRARLDHHLDELLDERGVAGLPPDVAQVLALGAYQILFMNGVPARAAVDESVELVRAVSPRRTGRWAAGLVNGVLRNLDRRRDALGLPDPADLARHLAVKHSHPEWMVARWVDRWGPEVAERFLEHNNRPPALHLAVHPGRTAPEALVERLAAAGHEARPHPAKPDCVVVASGARPDALPGWDEGLFWVQDAASQWVAELVDAPAGGSVLDACAAPGTKLCGILAREPTARALAVDSDPGRLGLVRENLERLRLPSGWIVAADARAVPTEATFPVVVADVPCSGTGVLRRRVDARWRRRPGDVGRFADLQRAILDGLADRVAPGGVLLYATFAQGNAELGPPRRPEFLLRPGELIERVRGELQIVAYEHGRVEAPRPAVRQRLCAVRDERPAALG